MAIPQSAIAFVTGFGVQGEIIYDGPVRAAAWQLISTPATNVIGARGCTVVSGPAGSQGDVCGVAAAGGTGVFAGIIANPKTYANFSGNLAATLTLPDDTIAELVTMGQMLIFSTTASNIGDNVVFDTTSGALSTIPSAVSFTASFATNVMTVTVAPGAGAIGVGSLIAAAGVAPGTYVVSGTGPYTLSTSPGTIAAEAVTATGFAGTGKQFVPTASTILRAGGANGLVMIELNI